ncbi:hypothetical protein [Reyranella sp.]|uniref:hypothetical protein n=1 Tax=Reyranella sp. TaxID=1929291 RepID=UPI0040354E73
MPDDPQFYPLPRIAADDFAEFAEILADDEDFPNNHWRWERMLDARKVELAEEGYTARLLDVRPAGFRRFLKESGGSPSMNGLAAYAALLAAYKR